ncbi:MAG: hypothetical protein PHG35_03830 [Dehalococcoidales bacterium]|nr:hypothetical protein [Dehalococcoidales bacterium]
MGLFKKKEKIPQEFTLFKTNPETFSLIFVHTVFSDNLQNMSHLLVPPSLDPQPIMINTPLGFFSYLEALSGLKLVPVPSINRKGFVDYKYIRCGYLSAFLAAGAAKLNISPKEYEKDLTEGRRIVLVGVESVQPPIMMYKTSEEAFRALPSHEFQKGTKPALGIYTDKSIRMYWWPNAQSPLRFSKEEYTFTLSFDLDDSWNTVDPTFLYLLKLFEEQVQDCLKTGLREIDKKATIFSLDSLFDRIDEFRSKEKKR